jgi:hypothetical protein
MKPKGYLVFHLNSAFSSIDREWAQALEMGGLQIL